jgi:hypothetical protein
MTDQRETPLDDHEAHASRALRGLRGIRRHALSKRAGVMVGILIGVAYGLGYLRITQAPGPLKALALVFAILELVVLLTLGVDAARVMRDWLWLRRQDWRDWRRWHQGRDPPRATLGEQSVGLSLAAEEVRRTGG